MGLKNLLSSNNMKEHNNVIALLAMIGLGMVFILGGTFQFMSGFHNVDLSVNMVLVDKCDMKDISQHPLLGTKMELSYQDLYLAGMMKLFSGFIMLIIGLVSFALPLGILLGKHDK